MNIITTTFCIFKRNEIFEKKKKKNVVVGEKKKILTIYGH